MPDSELRPDRLPPETVFFVQIGDQRIDLASMSYAELYTTFRTVLSAVRSALQAKANEQEEEAEQPAATGAHGG